MQHLVKSMVELNFSHIVVFIKTYVQRLKQPIMSAYGKQQNGKALIIGWLFKLLHYAFLYLLLLQNFANQTNKQTKKKLRSGK